MAGHPDPEGDEVVLYGQFGNMVSACAPRTARASLVEDAVNKKLRPKIGMYRTVDIATVRPGPSSPDACNQYANRQHWFLVNRRLGVWQQHLKSRGG